MKRDGSTRLVAAAIIIGLSLLWGSQAQAQKKIRFAYPSVADMGDVPSLLAWSQLKEQGYEVVPRFFSKTDLAVQAVIAGEADMGAAAGIAVIKAIEQGINLKIFAEQVRNEWQLMAPVSIKEPKQLDGKRVAYHAPFSLTEALVKWMANYYKLSPQWMIIPGSEVRAEALMRGQIDATPAEIADVLNVLESKPGQFHVLLSYAKIFPELLGTVYFARTDYLQTNGPVVEAVLEAVLRTHRTTEENPGQAKEAALKLLPGTKPGTIDAITKNYRDLRIWDVNGGVSRERGEGSLKFFEETGLMKKGVLNFERVFAPEHLEKALKKIGRR
ncbi:MAG: ABC transporter substrate-binding protein [Candidatus Binatia bacterium]